MKFSKSHYSKPCSDSSEELKNNKYTETGPTLDPLNKQQLIREKASLSPMLS